MNSLMAPSSTHSGREWVRDCSENFRHNPSMKDFRNLKVWEKAHQLALALYPVTTSFPRQEAYGLVSQVRRAASSIPSNIAEGCGREGDPELARFCIIGRERTETHGRRGARPYRPCAGRNTTDK